MQPSPGLVVLTGSSIVTIVGSVWITACWKLIGAGKTTPRTTALSAWRWVCSVCMGGGCV